MDRKEFERLLMKRLVQAQERGDGSWNGMAINVRGQFWLTCEHCGAKQFCTIGNLQEIRSTTINHKNGCVIDLLKSRLRIEHLREETYTEVGVGLGMDNGRCPVFAYALPEEALEAA